MSISARITAFLVAQKIVPAEDSDIYEYGFELLLADLFNFSVILLIGGISGHLWPSVLYLLIFVGLRSVCGGYHAKTHLRMPYLHNRPVCPFPGALPYPAAGGWGAAAFMGGYYRVGACYPVCPYPACEQAVVRNRGASATAGWRFFCILRLCAPRPCLDSLGGRKAS